MSDPFEGMQESKSPHIKFGKVGDWFKGTLTANDREVPNTLSAKKEMQRVYEFKMSGGSFHGITNNVPDAEATVIEAGSFWSYFAKPAIQSQMRQAKLGQIVGMRFVEEKAPSQPGRNATKVIKVFLGEMDPEYKGEQSADVGGNQW